MCIFLATYVGISARTTFTLKGRRQATNSEFSSTSGVQPEIALSHFSEINVESMFQTVEIGAGMLGFFVDDTPVTEYSPIVCDTFVD